jgi:hypothetical protein
MVGLLGNNAVAMAAVIAMASVAALGVLLLLVHHDQVERAANPAVSEVTAR